MRAFLIVVVCSVALAAQTGPPTVTNQDILNGLQDGTKWLTYLGNYFGHRHSPLTQITPDNVSQLKSQWTFQTGGVCTGNFQSTPLVIDGVLYVTGWGGDAWAIDARTGRQIWRHRRTLPDDIRACCGPNNRGFGALGDRLFLGTADAHLLSLDMRTGEVLWDAELTNYKSGYSVTVAPLVVKDKVIVGVAGAEYGIRGFIDAYDAQTGKRAWRFYTVPGPDDPGGNTWPRGSDAYLRGGGSIWVTGTYDPEQNLVFFGTGNPGPDYFSSVREGDNFIHGGGRRARCGHRQDQVAFPVHAARRARLGFDAGAGSRGSHHQCPAAPRRCCLPTETVLYVIDRTNGRMVLAKPFVQQTWAKGISPEGRPILVPERCRPKKGRKPVPMPAAERILFPFLRSVDEALHRHGARNVRDVLLLQRAVQGRRALRRWRRSTDARSGCTTARCARSIRPRAIASGNSAIRNASSSGVLDDRLGPGVCRRWRWQHHGVRFEDRAESVALPARRHDAINRRHDLHGGWPTGSSSVPAGSTLTAFALP